MKVFLVYPPGQTEIAQPYTSLPYLTAALEMNGHSVIQKDIGMEAIKFFTDVESLSESWEFVLARFKQLKKLKEKSGLPFKQQREFRELSKLIMWASTLRNKTLDEYKMALKIIKNKRDFFNPEKLDLALQSIDYIMRLVSMKYYPTYWSWESANVYNQKYNKSKVSSFIKALSNKQENLFMSFFDEQVLPQILKERPDLVGISISFFNQLVPSLTLAKMIKERNKNIHICLGGTTLMYMIEILQKNKELFSFFDSAILYEGETALLELLERLNTDQDLSKVPNIIFYNGRKIIKAERIHIEDVNLLPSPSYDGFKLEDYFSPEKVLVLNPSRGCYWNKCAFCGMCPTTRLSYRERRPELFLKDLLYLNKKYGVKYFSFNSDVISPSWLSRISTLILENKLSIKWDSEVRFEKGFTEKLCNKLYKAGCCYLRFGFESANQRVLNLMCKGTNLKTVKEVIGNCYKAKIRVGLEAFVGFPGETREEAEETVNFIIDNRDKIGSAVLGKFLLVKYSAIFNSPKEFGVTIKKSKSILQYKFDYKVKKGMISAQSKQFISRAKKKLDRLGLSHIFRKIYNSACGSVYSILYAAHYETKRILK